MSWDELYQSETAKAFDVAGSLPPERGPEKARNFWGIGVLKAPFTGIGRGLSEVAASTMDITKAAGIAAATTYADPAELFDKEKAEAGARARDAAAQQLQDEQRAGTFFVSEEGSSIRKATDFLKPDAKTASISENLVYSFTRMGSKLIAGSMMGPHGTALAAGEEGFTQSEELRQQGVSLGARSAVGSVTAGFTALAPLPLYGSTLAKTAGLYLIGGPGGFMAQQQASKMILEAADYGEIAKQFDPLDPVGFWASALVPLPFAAKGAIRNIKAKGADVPAIKAEGIKVEAETPPKVSQEAVDSAMVYNIVRMNDAHQKIAPVLEAMSVLRNSAAVSSIEPTIIRTLDAPKDGPPVVVRDPDGTVTAISGAKAIEEAAATGKQIDTVEIPRADYEALKASHKPEDIADAAVISTAKTEEAKAQPVAEAQQAEPPPQAKEQAPEVPKEVTAAKEAARQIAEEGKTFAEVKKELPPEVANLLAGILESGKNARRAQAILDDYARGVISRPGEPKVNIAADAVEAARSGAVSTPIKEGVNPKAVEQSARGMVGDRVDQVLKEDPDLTVGKDENGKTITAEEAMKEAQRQGREGTATELGTDDFKLIEAAIACALTFGGAA